MKDVLIVGAGIGGLTAALHLHRQGIACRVIEAVPAIRPLGVGINLLPHAMKELTDLGLQPALAAVAVETQEMCFYNRHGQFAFREARGRYAGYEWPQLSIHRGDLQMILFEEAKRRLGAERIHLGTRVLHAAQDDAGVTLHVTDAAGAALPPLTGEIAIGYDGIHSVIRGQLYPDEGAPAYSGINMWRGVTWAKPYLTGASMVLAGWLEVGKMVIYPIRRQLDDQGRQMINWVAEIESDTYEKNDWSKPGRREDFFPMFRDWRFDWLDIAGLIENAEVILEYPMVDRDPLPQWSFGRITLAGDAAHPMYPRGSNGAGQAILDARALAAHLKAAADPVAALRAYDTERNPATAKVVLTNRQNPPDAILREVHRRTGGRPFERIEDVISQDEMMAMSEGYKKTAGFDRASLAAAGPAGKTPLAS